MATLQKKSLGIGINPEIRLKMTQTYNCYICLFSNCGIEVKVIFFKRMNLDLIGL